MTFNTINNLFLQGQILEGFKPCYKWMTFNTKIKYYIGGFKYGSFKPCYKWMTFNTISDYMTRNADAVLNLVING